MALETHCGDARQQHLDRIQLEHHLHGGVCVLGIRAAVAEGVRLERRHAPVARRAHPHPVLTAFRVSWKSSRRGVLEAHGAAGTACEDGREDEEHLVTDVAAPEGATEVWADDPDLVQRHVQHLGDMHASLVGLVEVRPAGEFAALPTHQAAARVETAVIGAVVARGDLDDHVRVCEPLGHVAALVEDVLLRVSATGKRLPLGLIWVDQGSARGEGVLGAQREGQLLPLDLEEAQSLHRDLLGLGGDHGAGFVADPATWS